MGNVFFNFLSILVILLKLSLHLLYTSNNFSLVFFELQRSCCIINRIHPYFPFVTLQITIIYGTVNYIQCGYRTYSAHQGGFFL